MMHNKNILVNGIVAILYGYNFAAQKVIYRAAKEEGGDVKPMFIEFPIFYNPPACSTSQNFREITGKKKGGSLP